MTYWRATVERPDGDGGWVVVGVFGTPDTPGNGIARYLHGDTALAAAQILLTHVWPFELGSPVDPNNPGTWWADKVRAYTGIADHRITVEVDDSKPWSIPPGQAWLGPFTVTVAELRLMEIRAQVAALADARATLKELSEQVRRARSDVRICKFRMEEATREALRAGVAERDVTQAARTPSRPRQKKPTSTT
jgi:hypothetical protein